MGQAPLKNPKYLLIGDGKLSRHLHHYFLSLNISFETWSRKANTQAELQSCLTSCDVILLAIKDSAIEKFYKQHLSDSNKPCVHFSGALQLEKVYGFHPLMTFSNQLYSSEFYKTIAFISTHKDPQFEELFPKLSNPNFKIPADKKALYHSYCVVAGNFSNLLWKAVFERFKTQLELPEDVLKPYLQAVFENLHANPTGSLTGPLAREDYTTIDKNLASLEGDELRNLYLSFYQFYQNEKKETLREHLEF